MAKLIGIYSVAQNEGKSTLAQSMAHILSKNEHKVLFVELDYYRPTFALKTGLSHESKNLFNFFTNVKETKRLEVSKYISQVNEGLPEDKRLANNVLANNYSPNLHFLTLPYSFKPSTFPELLDENKESVIGSPINVFAEALTERLKELPYDVVIMTLPTDINSIFTYPIMMYCDEIINVITPNFVSMNIYSSIHKEIKSNDDVNIYAKWNTVFNKVNDGVPAAQYDRLLGNEDVMLQIPFDIERLENDLLYKIGATEFDVNVERLIERLGFKLLESQSNKGSMFFRKGR